MVINPRLGALISFRYKYGMDLHFRMYRYFGSPGADTEEEEEAALCFWLGRDDTVSMYPIHSFNLEYMHEGSVICLRLKPPVPIYQLLLFFDIM